MAEPEWLHGLDITLFGLAVCLVCLRATVASNRVFWEVVSGVCGMTIATALLCGVWRAVVDEPGVWIPISFWVWLLRK